MSETFRLRKQPNGLLSKISREAYALVESEREHLRFQLVAEVVRNLALHLSEYTAADSHLLWQVPCFCIRRNRCNESEH